MRIIRKFETLNSNYTYIFDNKLLNISEKLKFVKTLDYLEKYSYAFDNRLEFDVLDNLDCPIWQMWLQGEDGMPPLVRVCHNSVKKFCSDRNIILLTQDNIKNYVKLPKYIIEKYNKGIISKTHLSDIIRLILLYQHGGFWIDSTVYLTNCIPLNIQKSDFFVFKTVNGLIVDKDVSLDKYKLISNYLNKEAHLASNWFVKAKAGNKIIENVLKMLLEYWKNENKLINYFIFHYIFTIAILKNDNFKEEYINMPSYSNINVHLLQKCLFEKYDKNLFNLVKSMSDIHKLTYKNLNLNIYRDSFLNYLLHLSSNIQERERELKALFKFVELNKINSSAGNVYFPALEYFKEDAA